MKKFTLGSALIALASFSFVLSDMRIKLNTAGNTVGIFGGQTADYVTSRGGNFVDILDSSGKSEKQIKGFREVSSSLSDRQSNGETGFIGSYEYGNSRVDLFLTSNK